MRMASRENALVTYTACDPSGVSISVGTRQGVERPRTGAKNRGVSWIVGEGVLGERGWLTVGVDGVSDGRGEGVVGVVGDGERGGGVDQGVADDVVVAAGAQQDPDGGGVPVGSRRLSSTQAT